MRYLILALCVLSLSACCGTTPTSGVYAVQAPAVATDGACAPCGSAAAAPVQGPLMVAAGPAQLGVQYGVGPSDYAKAGFMIPAGLIGCVANFVRCATDQFFPVPTPSARYVSVQPVQYVQQAPAPAKACAPAAVPQFAPAPRKACPEPVGACTSPEACGVGTVASK